LSWWNAKVKVCKKGLFSLVYCLTFQNFAGQLNVFSSALPGRATSPAMSSHKLQRLNPMTVDDLSLMFGSMNHSNEWVDGILTHAWRKANRVMYSVL